MFSMKNCLMSGGSIQVLRIEQLLRERFKYEETTITKEEVTQGAVVQSDNLHGVATGSVKVEQKEVTHNSHLASILVDGSHRR